MRAIFGTNAKCQQEAERATTDKMLSDAERKVTLLVEALDERPACCLDEAIRQITAERH